MIAIHFSSPPARLKQNIAKPTPQRTPHEERRTAQTRPNSQGARPQQKKKSKKSQPTSGKMIAIHFSSPPAGLNQNIAEPLPTQRPSHPQMPLRGAASKIPGVPGWA
jgi:hypothetical protein